MTVFHCHLHELVPFLGMQRESLPEQKTTPTLNRGWLADPHLGHTHGLWSRVCSHAAQRHEPRHSARHLRWQGSSNASASSAGAVGRLIGKRPVWVLGDSHALDLWCALSCWLLRGGEPARHSVQAECFTANGVGNSTSVSRCLPSGVNVGVHAKPTIFDVSSGHKPPRGATQPSR